MGSVRLSGSGTKRVANEWRGGREGGRRGCQAGYFLTLWVDFCSVFEVLRGYKAFLLWACLLVRKRCSLCRSFHRGVGGLETPAPKSERWWEILKGDCTALLRRKLFMHYYHETFMQCAWMSANGGKKGEKARIKGILVMPAFLPRCVSTQQKEARGILK